MNTRLKQIRLSQKLSQEEFGKKIGIESRAHISALENGNRNITERIIKDICREFNISEEWLRTGKGEIYINPNINFGEICAKIGISDPKAQNAIIKYWKLSEEDKKLVWNFIEKILKFSPIDD